MKCIGCIGKDFGELVFLYQCEGCKMVRIADKDTPVCSCGWEGKKK
jgi:hypothetical protein